MIYASWNEQRLSRLMLGTVQFGMPYGVANRTGQPRYEDVREMVAAALAGGVNCFDTAAAYGASEEVLGRALQELGAAGDVIVATKVQPLTVEQLADPAQAATAITESVARSRQRLRLECLPIVLFHREADAVYGDVLHDLQARGWLRHCGVSCDNPPTGAARFIPSGHFAALQLPANVLDRRHLTSNLQAASRAGLAVFIRSVYLQGLLVMPEQSIPVALRGVIPWRQKLAALAAEAGMPLTELALRYMLSQEGVTCVLTGVETLAQVQDNLALFDKGPLTGDLLQALSTAVGDVPELLITPSQWPPA